MPGLTPTMILSSPWYWYYETSPDPQISYLWDFLWNTKAKNFRSDKCRAIQGNVLSYNIHLSFDVHSFILLPSQTKIFKQFRGTFSFYPLFLHNTPINTNLRSSPFPSTCRVDLQSNYMCIVVKAFVAITIDRIDHFQRKDRAILDAIEGDLQGAD